jgi:hypothetical protein
MQVEANMYDHTVIKGLSPVRKENGSEDDYTIYNDIENMGFISYIPLLIPRLMMIFTRKPTKSYLELMCYSKLAIRST